MRAARGRTADLQTARARTADVEETDGRVRRSVRSRERILDALMELIAEGDLQPTGQHVAERAGIGLRTVYRHFEDMEGLYRELNDRVVRTVAPRAETPPSGPLADRIDAMVRFRVKTYERIAPYFRSGATQRWRSRFLTETHAEMVRTLRDDLYRALPELADAAEHRREAIELVTSFEAWDRLRTEQKVGRERAQAILERTVRDLLDAEAGRARGR